MVLTERDNKILQFTGKWRFASLEQFLKTGIITASRKRAYNRLLQLTRSEHLKAGILGRGQIYYYLTPKGGEAAGYLDAYWSRRYKDARRDMVLKSLTACDYALATQIEYISRRDALDRLKAASYDVLKACLRGGQLYYLRGGLLHALVIDYGLSLKYMAQIVNTYCRLPPELRNEVVLDFLVFSEIRQKQVTALRRGAGVEVTAILANWKY